jgi:guanylate kinase
MENITVGQIVGAIGTLTVIVGFFVAIFKWYKSNFTDKFNDIESRLQELEDKTKNQGKEMQESKNERLILLKGQLACLEGLQQNGVSEPVTQAINEIKTYLINKSHE